MDHYAFPSVGVFVEKHNRYSNWEARVALAEGRLEQALKVGQELEANYKQYQIDDLSKVY